MFDPRKATREQLIAEIDRLQMFEMDVKGAPSDVADMMSVFGLAKQQALVLSVLRRGALVSHRALRSAMSVHKEDVSYSSLNVQICRLRKTVAPFGLTILNIWGAGYRLDNPKRLVKILEEAGF